MTRRQRAFVENYRDEMKLSDTPCLKCSDERILLCSDPVNAPHSKINGAKTEIGCWIFQDYVYRRPVSKASGQVVLNLS